MKIPFHPAPIINAFVGLFLCCCAHVSAGGFDRHNNVENSIAVTVDILQKDDEGHDMVKCAGVWVTDEIIVTANHCTMEPYEEGEDPTPAKSVRLALDAQHLEQVFDAPVIARDVKMDGALLQVFGARPHPWAPLAKRNPAVGTHVHVVGHPRGLAWTYLEGWVAQERSSAWDEDRPYIQIQVPITHGNSGGGAFNDDGELVGICDVVAESMPAQGFFNPVEDVKHMLDVAGVRQ